MTEPYAVPYWITSPPPRSASFLHHIKNRPSAIIFFSWTKQKKHQSSLPSAPSSMMKWSRRCSDLPKCCHPRVYFSPFLVIPGRLYPNPPPPCCYSNAFSVSVYDSAGSMPLKISTTSASTSLVSFRLPNRCHPFFFFLYVCVFSSRFLRRYSVILPLGAQPLCCILTAAGTALPWRHRRALGLIGFLRTFPNRAPVALPTHKTTEIPAVLFFFLLFFFLSLVCSLCLGPGSLLPPREDARFSVIIILPRLIPWNGAQVPANFPITAVIVLYFLFGFSFLCFRWGCTRCAVILRYMTRQLASCRRCFGMLIPSLSAADIFLNWTN